MAANKGRSARKTTEELLTYSATELAAQLGLTEKKLRRLVNRGEGPPSVKLGRGVVFRRAAVERWLVARERESVETLKRNAELVKKFAGQTGDAGGNPRTEKEQ